MDIIYLVYGLAFLALGLVVVIWPKRRRTASTTFALFDAVRSAHHILRR